MGRTANGNGSWADFPYYGTEKFWFIEDNTIRGGGGSIDVMNGGRYVARHNYFHDAAPNSHGTEGGPQRGARAREVYDNAFQQYNLVERHSMQRSGGALWHDNSWIGHGQQQPKSYCVRDFPRGRRDWEQSKSVGVWQAAIIPGT